LAGSPPLYRSFPLALGNSKPQGIADPDGSRRQGRSVDAGIGSVLAANTRSEPATTLIGDLTAALAPVVVAASVSDVAGTSSGSTTDRASDGTGLLTVADRNPSAFSQAKGDSTAVWTSGSAWENLLASSSRRAGRVASASDRLFGDLDWLDRFDLTCCRCCDRHDRLVARGRIAAGMRVEHLVSCDPSCAKKNRRQTMQRTTCFPTDRSSYSTCMADDHPDGFDANCGKCDLRR
jgi:hypothetical protein